MLPYFYLHFVRRKQMFIICVKMDTFHQAYFRLGLRLRVPSFAPGLQIILIDHGGVSVSVCLCGWVCVRACVYACACVPRSLYKIYDIW